jgi:hypothetical protein
MKKLFLLFFIFSNYFVIGEISSSIEDLVSLKEVEAKFIKACSKLIDQLSNDVKKIKMLR